VRRSKRTWQANIVARTTAEKRRWQALGALQDEGFSAESNVET